jgi:hypothetical protein
MVYSEQWKSAFNLLRKAGLPKRSIRSYALIGFGSSPDEAWARCNWIETHGIKALPMWFHPLNALNKNIVTDDQKQFGWTDNKRLEIMGWFYKHRLPK